MMRGAKCAPRPPFRACGPHGVLPSGRGGREREEQQPGTDRAARRVIRVRYDQDVALTGQVTTEYHFGRPNYGETPELDELERVPVLVLDEPLDAEPSEDATDPEDPWRYGCTDVRRVQLTGVNFNQLRELRGCGLRLEGRLWPGTTGHHHTRVLFALSDRTPDVTDHRQTFPEGRVTGTGTGFFLGKSPYVATNEHVVRRAKGITVTRGLWRGIAQLIHVDEATDFAVLKVGIEGEVDLPIRTWMGQQLGETVYVCGFPLRPILSHALNMTSGMVSCEVGIDSRRFQLSAAIQQGNSGGPVFDLRGNLLGVVVSKFKPSGRASETLQHTPENVNFALAAWPVATWCHDHGIILPDEKWEPVAPTALGKVAHQVCVEVERWE
jgi:hypothetical protein